MRSVMRIVVALVCFGALAAACDDGNSSANSPVQVTSATTTSAAPGTAKITTFTAPSSVQCGAGPSTTFDVAYAAEGAKTLQLLVDGRDNPGLDATSGTITVPVHCDAVAHTVVLIAADDKGGQTVQQKSLETKLP